jgi:RHS repeat-associated protein
MIAEANDATGAMIREYVWMDNLPVAMVDDSGSSPVIYYIHADHLGRPQKLTDQNANLVWDGTFDPFGNPTGISGSVTMPLMFPGQYWDSETQLSQNWNRDYDPTIGRYVQSDPIGLLAGINTYVYVFNDPVFFFDTSGLIELAGESRNNVFQNLSFDMCFWYPGACVKRSVICVKAVCRAACGQYYTVSNWLPDYPTSKEVSDLNQNCTCVTPQIDKSIRGPDN